MIIKHIIRFLHLCLILFVVLTPFLKTPWTIAVLHATTIISLLAHWYVDQDTCALTLLESLITGEPHNTSFMHQLVSPIYKIQDDRIKQIVWYVTPLLGLLSLFKLWMSKDLILNELVFLSRKIGLKPPI